MTTNENESKPRERHTDKLIAKAKTMKVTRLTDKSYLVRSPSLNDYTVCLLPNEQMVCNCEYAVHQQDAPTEENPNPEVKATTCSHTIAVAIKRANKEKKDLSLTTNTEKKTSKHKVVQDGVALLTRKRAAK